MRYLSVCSGIESATVAWQPLGWHAHAFSEIDRFACALLKHHYPHIPNYGDMTKFREWPDATIDLLVGGTPCQDYSVAGQRAGMDGARGSLTLTYLDIAERYRPQWLVWENVPGVLSSNRGRDFGKLLGRLGQLGYGWAYRILDVQYVRVDGFARALPQRRRRVFVIGYLGDWRCAAAVLFERESLSWNSPPRREAREDVAPTISVRTHGGSGLGADAALDDAVVAHALMGKASDSLDPSMSTYVAHTLTSEGFDASSDGAGRGTPIIPVAFAENSRSEVRLENGDGQISGALSVGGGKSGQGTPVIAFDARQDPCSSKHVAGSLSTYSQAQAVSYDLRGREDGAQFEGPHDTANIRAASGGSSRRYSCDWAVRRLTPRECERLMGFADDYTLIPYRGKPAKDGPRYKAIGNSKGVNAVRWLGMRIEQVNAISRLAA